MIDGHEVVHLSIGDDGTMNEDCYVLIHYVVPPGSKPRVHLFFIDNDNNREEPIGIFHSELTTYRAMDVHREAVLKYASHQQ